MSSQSTFTDVAEKKECYINSLLWQPRGLAPLLLFLMFWELQELQL